MYSKQNARYEVYNCPSRGLVDTNATYQTGERLA